MQKYVLNPKPEKSVKVYGRGLRISAKKSTEICRAITGMTLPKAQAFVEGLVTQKISLNRKYHTNTATEILSLLKSAEANAEFKGLNAERMFLHASAHEGFQYMTPRRFKSRGQRRKIAHVQIILEQR